MGFNSTTVTPNPTGTGAPGLSSAERVPYKKQIITPADITAGGKIDIGAVVRILNQMQGNSEDASEPTRSDPLGTKCIIKDVALVSGQQSNIIHTLGTAWRYAFIIGAASGAASCVLARAASPALSQDKYCSIVPTGTGTYDICVVAG